LSSLEGGTVTLVLETLRGDESLDFGGLGVGLLALALGLDFSSDNVLADLFCPSMISFSKVFLLVCLVFHLLDHYHCSL
jgi:hypothetical protein